jgi:hypothetical protein
MNQLVREVMMETVRQARELSKIVEGVPHVSLRGHFRESFLSRALRPWLPHGLELGTGVIVDENGTQRAVNEDDIVIYAPDLLPAVLPLVDRNIYLLDAVVACIEVKTTLSPEALKAAVAGAVALDGLKSSYEGKRETHAVFAYNSSVSVKSELVRLQSQVAQSGWSKPIPPIAIICVDEKECYMHGSIGGSAEMWFDMAPNAPTESTLAFLACLVSDLRDVRSSRRSVQIARFVSNAAKAMPIG